MNAARETEIGAERAVRRRGPWRWGGLGGLALLLLPGALRAGECWDCYRLFLKGLLAEHAGRTASALEAYQEVLRRDPEAGFLHFSVAEAALRSGQSEVALGAARQAVALSTGNAEGYLLLGRVHLARGENGEAQAAFDQAFRLDPSNIEALGWAASRRQISDPQGARGLYEKFLTSNPEADEVRARLAEIQQQQGDVPGAEASWKKVLELDPSNPDAPLALAGLYDVRGDTAAAIAAYESVLEKSPDNSEVLTRLGQLYYSQGRLEDSRDRFDRALRLAPEDEGLHFWRALVAQEGEHWEEAAHHMERAAKTSREPGVLLRLASYDSHQDKPKEALQVLKRLQRTQPENPDFMFYLALSYEEMEKPRPAIRWLDRALAKDPNRADLHFHLAINWDKRKRFDRATSHLLKVIELDPRHAVALNYLGYSWVDRNERLNEGLDLIQRAVALEPENLAYRDSLGWAYFRLGRLTEAEAALGPVARAANDSVVWSHYGDALESLGRHPEAVRAWQEGLLLDPRQPDLLKRLGEEGGPTRVVPLSAPRTLLKRVEGNFRQLDSLSGVAAVSVRMDGRAVSGHGLFYYSRPGVFRLEVLGPFFAPQAVLVYDGKAAHWVPAGLGSGQEGPWLALWAEVLSGAFFEKFDDPAVSVRQEGTTVVYTGPAGELRLDAREKSMIEARISPPGSAPLLLKFRGHREEEGLILPGVVEGESEADGFGFTLRFSRLAVNSSLSPALFIPAP